MDSRHNEDSALDSLEQKLNNPRAVFGSNDIHSIHGRKALELPTSWGDNSPIIMQAQENTGMTFGMKFLLISIVLLIAALSVTAWRVLSLRNVVSSENIDLSADIIPYVEGGSATPVTITLLNRNTSSLQNAVITLLYKKGTGAQDEQEKVQEKRDIGEVKSGEYKHQDFNVVLYGSEAEPRDLTLKLEYKVSGSNAVFSKVITVTTVLKTPPISVRIDGPNKLSIGQNGTFTITVKNNSSTSSLPSILQLVMPNTFTFAYADPKSNTKGYVWTIPSLNPGGSKKITITGTILGTQGENTVVKAILGSRGDTPTTIGVVYATQTFNVKLRVSPLSVTLSLDTATEGGETLKYGDRPTLGVSYVNVGDTPLYNVSLKMALSGDAALLKELDPSEGHYDYPSQTITWDKDNIPALAVLAPSANGNFQVNVPIVTRGINSPTLKVFLSGNATNQESEDVLSQVSKTWAVQGSASIAAQTTYKNSRIGNIGPIPPRANTQTSYTARITVAAQNTLSNGYVVFSLPTYVTWRGITSDSANISYDTKTRKVTWVISNLEGGKSISVDIGLIMTPSQSHVGSTPNITSGIVFEADEMVSRVHIRTTISALNTKLSGESWNGDPSTVVDQ